MFVKDISRLHSFYFCYFSFDNNEKELDSDMLHFNLVILGSCENNFMWYYICHDAMLISLVKFNCSLYFDIFSDEVCSHCIVLCLPKEFYRKSLITNARSLWKCTKKQVISFCQLLTRITRNHQEFSKICSPLNGHKMDNWPDRSAVTDQHAYYQAA